MAENQTIWQVVRTALPEIMDVEMKMGHLEREMGDPAVYENPRALARVLASHERLMDEFERLDGSRYESKVLLFYRST